MTMEIVDRLKDAEERLHQSARQLADLYRRSLGKKTTDGLHAEQQFYRRLREFANREINDVEGVIQDPDHYSR